MTAPKNTPAHIMTANADFLEELLEVEQLARELRDRLGNFLTMAPTTEAEWIATMTDPAVCKGLGALLMLTGKTHQWINEGANQSAGVINESAPVYAESVIDHLVEGQVEAEMSCGCARCVPCGLRREHGEDIAKRMLYDELRPRLGKQRRKIVDPRGRPMH